MKNFTLTLYAKRKSDGSYDYSLKAWENRSTGALSATANFESSTIIGHQLNAVLPVGGDSKLSDSDSERAAESWFPFTMPMSEEQAANLGRRSDSPLDRSLLN